MDAEKKHKIEEPIGHDADYKRARLHARLTEALIQLGGFSSTPEKKRCLVPKGSDDATKRVQALKQAGGSIAHMDQ